LYTAMSVACSSWVRAKWKWPATRFTTMLPARLHPSPTCLNTGGGGGEEDPACA
jgi:hypothetical protein